MYVLKNYQPWSISVDQFPEKSSLEKKLIFLLGYAVLAPSSHNTQPWSFFVNESTVRIFANDERHLMASDPTGRQMYISLGCCIENFKIALDAFNVKYSFKILSLNDSNLPTAEFQVDKETVFDCVLAKNSDYLTAIISRHGNKSKHEISRTSEVKQFLEGFFVKYNNPPFIITEPSGRRIIAKLNREGSMLSQQNKNFAEELSHWVKNNYTRSPLGMPLFISGVPGPLSLIVPRLIRMAKPNKKMLDDDFKILSEATNAFLVWTVDSESKQNFLLLGQKLQNFILSATLQNLQVSFYTAAIEVDDLYSNLQELVHTEGRPSALLRVGFCLNNKGRATPRLTARECLKN